MEFVKKVFPLTWDGKSFHCGTVEKSLYLYVIGIAQLYCVAYYKGQLLEHSWHRSHDDEGLMKEFVCLSETQILVWCHTSWAAMLWNVVHKGRTSQDAYTKSTLFYDIQIRTVNAWKISMLQPYQRNAFWGVHQRKQRFPSPGDSASNSPEEDTSSNDPPLQKFKQAGHYALQKNNALLDVAMLESNGRDTFSLWIGILNIEHLQVPKPTFQ